MELSKQGKPSGPTVRLEKTRVPHELRVILLDLTLNYLLDQPDDVVIFGLNYFKGLQARKTRAKELFRETADERVEAADDGSDARSPSWSESEDEEDAMTVERESRRRLTGPERSTEDAGGRVPKTPSKLPAPRARRNTVFSEPIDPERMSLGSIQESRVFPKTDAQRTTLERVMRNVLLFKNLDHEQFNTILDAMQEKRVVRGEYVIKEGEDGDYFYVIEGGSFEATKRKEEEEIVVNKYNNEGSFGELALMYNVPRSASVRSTAEGRLWALDRDTFRRIVCTSEFKRRKLYRDLISNVPILKELNEGEIHDLADALTPKAFNDGDTILRQGDAATGMFFVESGNVIVSIQDDRGTDVFLRKITTGGYFGELALITKKPRAATAVAEGQVKLAFLEAEAFERLLGPCKEVMSRDIAGYSKQLYDLFGPRVAHIVENER